MFILVRCINRVLHHTRGLDLSLLLRRFPPAEPGNQSYAPNTKFWQLYRNEYNNKSSYFESASLLLTVYSKLTIYIAVVRKKIYFLYYRIVFRGFQNKQTMFRNCN